MGESLFIIIKSLKEMIKTLGLMIREGRVVNQRLVEYYVKYPYFADDDSPEIEEEQSEAFYEICERFWDLEHSFECSARTAILMAAIDLEASVNRFCFYNMGEVTTDAIETLPIPSKLTVVHRVLGLSDFKGTKPYEAVRSLVNWRNAFAHGKCTDMPTRSLKENHLTQPKELTDASSIIQETLRDSRKLKYPRGDGKLTFWEKANLIF